MNPEKPARVRKTIAVLIDNMDLFVSGYESEVRRSFDAVGREHDLNVLFVYGGALAGPPEWCSGYNAVYDLLDRDRVDGVVVFSGALAHYVGLPGLIDWCERHRSLPLCSVGVAVPGVPSVVIDNRLGMEAMVEHVISDHGCRRVAFIAGSSGNPEAQLRFEAYRSVLERHGLPLDPALVVCGDFSSVVGRSAMEGLLRSGLRPDAVVAANDGMALGAMEALHSRGSRVPQDVVVTGFDDLPLARLASSPLTTVAQPFSRLARAAIGTVLEQLAGRPVEALTSLPMQVIVRQSCGCNRRSRASGTAAHPEPVRSAAEMLGENRQRLEQLFDAPPWSELTLPAGERSPWLESLQAEFEGRPGSFLRLLDDALGRLGPDDAQLEELLRAVGRLADLAGGTHGSELGLFWSEAASSITLTMARGQAERRFETAESFMRVARAGDYCSRALDLPSLKDALAWAASNLRMDTVFVGGYPEDGSDELEPIFWLVDAKSREQPSGRMAARDLYPRGTELDDRRHTCLVFPLVFETRLLGLAVFEHRAGGEGYQMFRDQIAAALRSVNLMQEVVERTTQHERSVQERIATAKRMEALRVLAGGVAHDLNNALGPLIALPDVLLRELSNIAAGNVMQVGEMRDDLETIRSASLRAADTIKDLLVMSRQGRTTKDLVDLNRVVARCLVSEPLGSTRAEGREVNITLDLCQDALLVEASESHLSRAIANLVRNGVEAIEGNGEVAVKTARATLAEPTSGYETIDPGEYALVTVSDSGAGIAPHDLGRVFEPFFSRKRLRQHSGSGLGLAIVHGVVKEHQGFADVQSTVGQGTVFDLYFPIAAHVPKSTAESSVPPCGSARVLIVDDEASQLRTGRRVLTQLGYQVDTLASGAQALALFRQAAVSGATNAGCDRDESPYDLVIFDMVLDEECDGLLVSEHVRQLFPEQRIIIVSGHAPTERVEAALKEGLTWLAKPYTADALARAVRQACRA